MRLRSLRPLIAVILVLAAATTCVEAADNYKVDPVHTFAMYRIKHFDIGYSYGRFNDVSGMVMWDKDDPTKSSFTFEVKADSLDTHNDKRDAHLKGPDFFDVKQFPTISFKSTAVKSSGDNKFDVTGDLTMHGVTKSITVPIEKTGEGDTKMMGVRTGWETTVNLKRSDYDIKGLLGPVADDVMIRISFEAVKQ
jgi:polyisoprenoid-binding protein YceI